MKKEEQRLIALFRKARDFDLTRFEDYRELMAFYEGNQDLLSRYSENKPWVVSMNTPFASLAIDTRVASLQASDYMGVLQPLSPDDVENIEKLNNLYHNEWKLMNMDSKINDAISRAAIAREAYIHVIFNPDRIKGGTNRLQKGVLEAYFLEPGSVLIDPKALEMKNADYIIVTERLTPEQAKSMYGISTEDDDAPNSVFTPQDRGEMYIDNDYDTEQYDVLTKMTFYERKGDIIYKTCMVEEKIVTEKMKLEINVFPIAQLRWEKKAQSPYGLSLMDRLLPEQKAINSIESAIVNSTLSTVAPQYVVRKDSGLDPKKVANFSGAPGVVYSVNGDPTNAIVPLNNPKIDPQIIEIKREYELTIDKIASRSQEFLGRFGTAGNTASGAAAASSRATIIEQKFLSNMENFIEDLTRIIVEFLTKAFEGETMFTRSEERADGSFEFGEIEVSEDMKEMEYTFWIDLEIKTRYSRERERQLLLELFQFERQYDAPVKTITVKDLLQKFEVSNRQELVERYDKLSRQDNAMKSGIIDRFTRIIVGADIDERLVQQGIQEIMMGNETPTVDEILKQIEQQRQEMEMMEERMQQDEMEMMEQEMDLPNQIQEPPVDELMKQFTGGMGTSPGQTIADLMGGAQEQTPNMEEEQSQMATEEELMEEQPQTTPSL
jgi:hypothetical protein